MSEKIFPSPTTPFTEVSQIGRGEPTDVNSSEVTTNPGPPPQVLVKPGWQTSEGILTAGFGLILSIFAYFNWITPTQATNWGDRIATLLNNAGPLFAYVPVLWHYFTSRGKLKSNATLANAAILTPSITNKLTQASLMNPDGSSLASGSAGLPMDQNDVATLGMLKGIDIGSILGGKNWKDPVRIGNILKIAGGLAPGAAGRIIGGITGGSGTPSAIPTPSGDPEFQSEVEEGFKTVVKSIQDTQNAMVLQWNTMRPDLRVNDFETLSNRLNSLIVQSSAAAPGPLPKPQPPPITRQSEK